MKATGEVMAIGQSFELAMMKAAISIELGLETLTLPELEEKSDEQIKACCIMQTTSDFCSIRSAQTAYQLGYDF